MSASATIKQQRILDTVRDWGLTHFSPPTQAELARECGYRSTNSIRSHLKLLEKKHLIVREANKARTVRLVERSPREDSRPPGENVGIPVFGTIAAGPLSEAIESTDEMIAVSPDLFRGRDLFALRIGGESMKDAGVLPGDFAVISRQNDIADHKIAAVMVNGEATLKRIVKGKEKVVLRPANQDLEDIPVTPSEDLNLRILGQLVGIIRTEVG